MSMSAYMCVCVCACWGVGVNVIANVLMAPKACHPPHPPPKEADPDRRCCDNGTLVSVTPRGIWRGWVRGVGAGYSNMLTVWNMRPQMCSFTQISNIKSHTHTHKNKLGQALHWFSLEEVTSSLWKLVSNYHSSSTQVYQHPEFVSKVCVTVWLWLMWHLMGRTASLASLPLWEEAS